MNDLSEFYQSFVRPDIAKLTQLITDQQDTINVMKSEIDYLTRQSNGMHSPRKSIDAYLQKDSVESKRLLIENKMRTSQNNLAQYTPRKSHQLSYLNGLSANTKSTTPTNLSVVQDSPLKTPKKLPTKSLTPKKIETKPASSRLAALANPKKVSVKKEQQPEEDKKKKKLSSQKDKTVKTARETPKMTVKVTSKGVSEEASKEKITEKSRNLTKATTRVLKEKKDEEKAKDLSLSKTKTQKLGQKKIESASKKKEDKKEEKKEEMKKDAKQETNNLELLKLDLDEIITGLDLNQQKEQQNPESNQIEIQETNQESDHPFKDPFSLRIKQSMDQLTFSEEIQDENQFVETNKGESEMTKNEPETQMFEKELTPESKQDGILESKQDGILESKQEDILEQKQDDILESKQEDILESKQEEVMVQKHVVEKDLIKASSIREDLNKESVKQEEDLNEPEMRVDAENVESNEDAKKETENDDSSQIETAQVEKKIMDYSLVKKMLRKSWLIQKYTIKSEENGVKMEEEKARVEEIQVEKPQDLEQQAEQEIIEQQPAVIQQTDEQQNIEQQLDIVSNNVEIEENNVEKKENAIEQKQTLKNEFMTEQKNLDYKDLEHQATIELLFQKYSSKLSNNQEDLKKKMTREDFQCMMEKQTTLDYLFKMDTQKSELSEPVHAQPSEKLLEMDCDLKSKPSEKPLEVDRDMKATLDLLFEAGTHKNEDQQESNQSKPTDFLDLKKSGELRATLDILLTKKTELSENKHTEWFDKKDTELDAIKHALTAKTVYLDQPAHPYFKQATQPLRDDDFVRQPTDFFVEKQKAQDFLRKRTSNAVIDNAQDTALESKGTLQQLFAEEDVTALESKGTLQQLFAEEETKEQENQGEQDKQSSHDSQLFSSQELYKKSQNQVEIELQRRSTKPSEDIQDSLKCKQSLSTNPYEQEKDEPEEMISRMQTLQLLFQEKTQELHKTDIPGHNELGRVLHSQIEEEFQKQNTLQKLFQEEEAPEFKPKIKALLEESYNKARSLYLALEQPCTDQSVE